VDEIIERLGALDDRLSLLERRLTGPTVVLAVDDGGDSASLVPVVASAAQPTAMPETPAPMEPATEPTEVSDFEAFRRQAVLALEELDGRFRYGGLVPLGKLRQELRRLGLTLGRSVEDEYLLELARRYVIDLQVVHDAHAVTDPEQGIWRDGRGLLYFAVMRS
jgi:hypothetical protein